MARLERRRRQFEGRKVVVFPSFKPLAAALHQALSLFSDHHYHSSAIYSSEMEEKRKKQYCSEFHHYKRVRDCTVLKKDENARALRLKLHDKWHREVSWKAKDGEKRSRLIQG